MAQDDRIQFAKGSIEINAGRAKTRLRIENTGDRAIQVGSHFHIFEANRALRFDRVAALGMHLDIPAGTAVRFEPGETHEVELCAYGGTGSLLGFNGLVHGGLRAPDTRARAIHRMRERGFGDTGETKDDPHSGRAKKTTTSKSGGR